VHFDSDGMCKVHAEIIHEFLMDTVIDSEISFYQNFFDVVKFLFHNLSSCHGNTSKYKWSSCEIEIILQLYSRERKKTSLELGRAIFKSLICCFMAGWPKSIT